MAKPILPTPPVTGEDAEEIRASLPDVAPLDEQRRRIAWAARHMAEMMRPKGAGPKAAALAASEAAGAEYVAISDPRVTKALFGTVRAETAAERDACAAICERRAEQVRDAERVALDLGDKAQAGLHWAIARALARAAEEIRGRGGKG